MKRLSKEELAFVEGAKWWEWKTTGATMWNSDRRDAEAEAVKRKANGTLGERRSWHGKAIKS